MQQLTQTDINLVLFGLLGDDALALKSLQSKATLERATELKKSSVVTGFFQQLHNCDGIPIVICTYKRSGEDKDKADFEIAIIFQQCMQSSLQMLKR